MARTVLLREIMETSLLTFSPETDINLALNTLLQRRFSGAPVVHPDGTLAGVLSQKDCLKAMLNSYYHHTYGGSVRDYMTPDVETLTPEMNLVETANRFINSTYRRFPILEGNTLVGQISRRDILQVVKQYWT